MSTKTRLALTLFSFALAPIGCLAQPLENEDEAFDQNSTEVINGSGGGSSVGKPCKVTGGLNKGKTGTFTNETDGLNCSGSWGATACTDSDGKDNGKCKATIKVTLPPIAVPIGDGVLSR